jgi:uncharacterized RDD family membrane protein YckC
MDPYNTADALKIERPQPVVSPATEPRAGSPYAGDPRGGSNPYAAPGARIAEGRNDEKGLASRGARLAAVILDSLILAGPAVLLAVLLPGLQGVQRGSLSGGSTVLLAVIGVWCIGFAIYQLMLLHQQGQTLGKKIMGVRIVRSDGSRASLRRIFFLRYFGPSLIGAIPFIGGFFSLADALLIFSAEKRCIHDHFADTIVVEA